MTQAEPSWAAVDLAEPAIEEFTYQEQQFLLLARIPAKHYRPPAEPIPWRDEN